MSKKELLTIPEGLECNRNYEQKSRRRTEQQQEFDVRANAPKMPASCASKSYDPSAFRGYGANQDHEQELKTLSYAVPPLEPSLHVTETETRHWNFLFQNLHSAIMRIYYTAQHDNSIEKCKETMRSLQKYWQNFNALIEKIFMSSVPQTPSGPASPHSSKHNKHPQVEIISDKRAKNSRHRQTRDEMFSYPVENTMEQRKEQLEHYDELDRCNQDKLSMRKPVVNRRHLSEPSESTNSASEEELIDERAINPTEKANSKIRYTEKIKISQKRISKSNENRERRGEIYEERQNKPEGKRMYEKLFGNTRQSRDIQREIEKFHNILLRNKKIEKDVPGDADRDTKIVTSPKRDIMDNTVHNDRIFEYSEDDENLKQNCNDSNDDDYPEDADVIEEISSPRFKERAHSYIRNAADRKSPQQRTERATSEPESESIAVQKQRIRSKSSRSSSRRPEEFVADYEVD